MSSGFVSEGISSVLQSRVHISSFWSRSRLCKCVLWAYVLSLAACVELVMLWEQQFAAFNEYEPYLCYHISDLLAGTYQPNSGYFYSK